MEMVTAGYPAATAPRRAYTPSYLRTAQPYLPAPVSATANPLDQITRLLQSAAGQPDETGEAPPQKSQKKKGGLLSFLTKAALVIGGLIVAKKVFGALRSRQTTQQETGLNLEA